MISLRLSSRSRFSKVFSIGALVLLSGALAGAEEPSLEELRALLVDPANSPDVRERARDDLGAALKSAESAEEKGRIYLLLAADAHFGQQNLKQALPLYDEARKQLPVGQREWLEATLGLGIVWQNNLPVTPDSLKRVEVLYMELLQHDASSALAAQAMLNLARMHEIFDFAGDTQNLPEARRLYLEITEKWPSEDIAHEAAMRLGSTYIQEAYYPPAAQRTDWDWRIEKILEGIAFLRQWAETHPEHSLTPGLWEYIGNSYIMLPESEAWRAAALQAYLRSTGDGDLMETGQPVARKTSLDRVNPGYLYLRIAGLAQQQGNREVALEYYCRLISEAPDYGRGPESALQLTAHLGYTREDVVARVRQQLQGLGHSDAAVANLLGEFEFLEPPVGLEVPHP